MGGAIENHPAVLRQIMPFVNVLRTDCNLNTKTTNTLSDIIILFNL
jgi:hypothetical protein